MSDTAPSAPGGDPWGAVAAPRDGDLLLTCEPGEPCLYSLARLPERPQIRWSSRVEALDVAGAFARRYSLDVWLCDGTLLTRLVHARPHAGFARQSRGGR